MAFKLPNLPYAYDALEPYIDQRTMEFHHDKHHNTYVTKLNATVEGTELEHQSLADMIANLDKVPEAMRMSVVIMAVVILTIHYSGKYYHLILKKKVA